MQFCKKGLWKKKWLLKQPAGRLSVRLALPSPAPYSLIPLNFRPASLSAVFGESDKQIFWRDKNRYAPIVGYENHGVFDADVFLSEIGFV